jgi:hypothetical protein
MTIRLRSDGRVASWRGRRTRKRRKGGGYRVGQMGTEREREK